MFHDSTTQFLGNFLNRQKKMLNNKIETPIYVGTDV